MNVRGLTGGAIGFLCACSMWAIWSLFDSSKGPVDGHAGPPLSSEGNEEPKLVIDAAPLIEQLLSKHSMELEVLTQTNVELAERVKNYETVEKPALEARIETLRYALTMLERDAAHNKEERAMLAREIESLKSELQTVERLLREARSIVQKQSQQIGRLRYTGFVLDAQLRACTGSQAKVAACRTELERALLRASFEQTFVECVTTGQAEPILVRVESGAAPPPRSLMLVQGSVGAAAWYAVPCDPTLPEATVDGIP